MRTRCTQCGYDGEWEFVAEYVDGMDRRWEAYRCPDCGAIRKYAVA